MSESKRKRPYQPTPEQLALAEERRKKKAAIKAAQKEAEKIEEEDRSHIFPREWLSTTRPQPEDVTIKVMTWNVSYFILTTISYFSTDYILCSFLHNA